MPDDKLVAVETPLRMGRGQVSHSALMAINGKILEECNQDLRWPQCITTYKNMMKDATIAPSVNSIEMSIAKVNWTVKIPEGYEKELASKAKFVEQVMNDMGHSWYDFIKKASSFSRYGFSAVEKVYRRRLRTQGSKYNDGLIGIRKLHNIDQDSVADWDWDAHGELTGLRQWDKRPTGPNNTHYEYFADPNPIPRRKFMLFRADSIKDNPEGVSPLNGIYVAWRFKTELEKFESMGVSQDLRGLRVLRVPSRYMHEGASDEEKATFEAFQRALNLMHKGEQSGIIIPSDSDENKNPYFDFDLKSITGTATYDIDKIINRWRNEIITGLFCQQLILGQNGSGSFALSESLQGATEILVRTRLQEIKDQINHDLIPQLFALNGWDIENIPYLDFDEFNDDNIDDFSKAVQRIAAVGGLVLNAETINMIHEKIGLPVPFDDVNVSIEDVRHLTTPVETGSGEGMERGTSGNGTSQSSSGRDNSTSNTEN